MTVSAQTFDETQHPRDSSGQFTTKPATESDADLGGAGPVLGTDLTGDVSFAADRWGQVATVEGPTLYLGAAVSSKHVGDESYLRDRWHRLEAFVDEHYGAVCVAPDDGADEVDELQVSWRVLFEHAAASDRDRLADDVGQRLAEHGGPARLAADLEEGPGGRSVFSARLEEHLRRADAAAQNPRDLTVAELGVDVDQRTLDRAVATAREHNDIVKRITWPEARRGSLIARHPDGRIGVYDAGAWQPPTSRPMLPWRAPEATPFAKVDLDGHASPLTEQETPCRGCGQPLGDRASTDVGGTCQACTGEWSAGRGD